MNVNKKANRISKKHILYIGMALGILMIILSYFTDSTKTEKFSDDYGTRLEERLTQLISGAIGCDKSLVDVIITFENPSQTPSEEYENINFFGLTSENNKTDLRQQSISKVKGAVIVCKDINTPSDFEIIRKAVATALGTTKNKIYIIGGASST